MERGWSEKPLFGRDILYETWKRITSHVRGSRGVVLKLHCHVFMCLRDLLCLTNSPKDSWPNCPAGS